MNMLDTLVSGLHDDMFWSAFDVSLSNRWGQLFKAGLWIILG